MIIKSKEAVSILKNSGIVAIPTETVYGLMGVATDAKAVEKIYQTKNRPKDNPLICHFYSFSQIQKYIQTFPSYFPKLIARFSPGPISYLLEIPKDSPLMVSTNNLAQVAVRIPMHEVALSILEDIDLPLAGPSANTSTKFSGTNPEMIEADLGDKIDGIVDGGHSDFGLESTILDCRNEDQVKILRPGAIGKIELEKFFKEIDLSIQVLEIPFTPFIPGNKYKHYSPNTPISLFQDLKQVATKDKIAILGEKDSLSKLNILRKDKVVYINLGNNIREISKNFYTNLFYLDTLRVSQAFYIPIKPRKCSLYLALENKLVKILN